MNGSISIFGATRDAKVCFTNICAASKSIENEAETVIIEEKFLIGLVLKNVLI